MIKESKKIEFWNFLTAEKNQARPKGITMQRLAVIKSAILKSDIWTEIIGRHEAADKTAQEFYQSADAAAALSRTQFWEAVRGIIRQGETERQNTEGRRNPRSNTNGGKRRVSANSRRKRF